MKVAAYIYKPAEKEYDFDQLFDYLKANLDKLDPALRDITEVYADGWVDIPNGIDDLLADIKHYDLVILYSYEGLSNNHMNKLFAGTKVYCVLTPWIGVCNSPSTEAAKKVVSTVEAKQYYKSLRSLSIRAGIKASDKQSGAAPFGYRYDDNGTLQPDEDHGTLELIKTMKATGFSVVEIAKKTGLKEKKIYHILHYWRGK
jgi:hypothetical protein